MEEPDYVAELERIRVAYINSLPRQRLSVIRQRLANPNHGPNTLVTRVSAVEALARSLVMHGSSKAGHPPSSQYGRFRAADPDKLVAFYLEQLRLEKPDQVFGQATWQRFRYAVSYRNLLVHECTYLGQDKYPYLEQACDLILAKLVELAGIAVEA